MLAWSNLLKHVADRSFLYHLLIHVIFQIKRRSAFFRSQNLFEVFAEFLFSKGLKEEISFEDLRHSQMKYLERWGIIIDPHDSWMICLFLMDYFQECSGGCQDQLSAPDNASMLRRGPNIGHSTGQYIDRSSLVSRICQGAEIASHEMFLEIKVLTRVHWEAQGFTCHFPLMIESPGVARNGTTLFASTCWYEYKKLRVGWDNLPPRDDLLNWT